MAIENNKPDYHCEINVNESDNKAFECLTIGIPDWWSKNFEGSANNLNDVFTVHFRNTFKTMKIEEIIHNKRIVWQCIDAYIDMVSLKNKSEWIGTKLIWEIESKNTITSISLTHIGLTTDMQCYSVCEKGWDFYVTQSIFNLLAENKGIPSEA